LIEILNQNVRGRVNLGKIDLLQNFSFFEVESSEAEKVISSMNKAEFLGRRISVEIAQEKQGGERERGGGSSERGGSYGRRVETQEDYSSVRKNNFAKRKEGDRNRVNRTNDRGSFGTRKPTERKKRY